jgi:hypothetical protein
MHDPCAHDDRLPGIGAEVEVVHALGGQPLEKLETESSEADVAQGGRQVVVLSDGHPG